MPRLTPLLPVLLLACGGEPSAPPAPGPHAEQDPAGQREAVLAVSDPLERGALVLEMLRSSPQTARGLCELLQPGLVQDYCRQLEQRPHLTAPPLPRPAPGRTAPGPASAQLRPSEEKAVPAAAPDADPGSCAPGAERVACLSLAARTLAQRDPAQAAARCAAIGIPQLRMECYFTAAEQLANRRFLEVYGAATDLCLQARRFAPQCLSHHGQRTAQSLAASLTGEGEQALPVLVQGADTVRAAFQARLPELADDAVSRYWSAVIMQLLGETTSLSGDLEERLPPAAIPHLHATLALRLLAMEGREARGLAGWVERLEQVLATRGLPLEPWPEHQISLGGRRSWTEDRPGDTAIPAAHLLVSSRRTWAQGDRAADLAICLLEASVRSPELDPGSLLAEGAEHDHALVRWTAERLQDERHRRRKGPSPPG